MDMICQSQIDMIYQSHTDMFCQSHIDLICQSHIEMVWQSQHFKQLILTLPGVAVFIIITICILIGSQIKTDLLGWMVKTICTNTHTEPCGFHYWRQFFLFSLSSPCLPFSKRCSAWTPDNVIFGWTDVGNFKSCPRFPKLWIWLLGCWGICLKVTCPKNNSPHADGTCEYLNALMASQEQFQRWVMQEPITDFA